MASERSGNPRIGLALGSGAARGWSQIGIIETLLEAGIVPEVVCGTSIGSVVGAAYVTGRMAELKAFALGLTRREMIALLDVRLNAGGLIDGKRIMAALVTLGIDGDIGALPRPFAAVATDLETGREIWLREGALQDAVRASIALPGVLGPHLVDGRWLGDGGMVNPVPVSVCRALGAEVIIAVNLNGDIVTPFEPGFFRRMTGTDSNGQLVRQVTERLPVAMREPAAAILPKLLVPGRDAPGYLEVLMNSINVMQDQITRSRLAGEPPHVLLVPRLRSITTFDFDRAEESIAIGRQAAEGALPELKRILGR